MPESADGNTVTESLKKLIFYLEQEQYRGYDPYDALMSPLLRTLSFNSKYPRIAVTQLLKWLPVNIRPLLGIKKGLNPKALGLFLWGYARLHAVERREEHLSNIERLMNMLEETRSRGYSGNCWGYNFDWQSRAFYVPRWTPTIVNSSFIGHALIDAYRLTGRERALDMALPIKDFIIRDINRTREGGSFCFSYTPGDHLAVHNANLLGASLLIRLYAYCRDEALRELSLSSLAYSLKYQRDDGSWYYAETDYQDWIDSFHTGYNLQSLLYFMQEGFEEQAGSAFSKGVLFYRNNFFLEDGTPKYYHDRVAAIDIHAPAQAVAFFCMMGPKYSDFTKLVLEWMQKNLHDQAGYYYFRKTRRMTNRISYMRWSQAWAFHALTSYLMAEHENMNKAGDR